MKQRNSSIELARIVFTIGVILGHYCFNGLSYDSLASANYVWMQCMATFSCTVVGFFVMISGYCLANIQTRKFIKVVQLVVQAVIFNLAFYFGSVLLGQNPFSARELVNRFVPDNFFVVLYCCLYIISPYINYLVDKLDKKGLKKLVITLFVIFSVLSFINDVLVKTVGSGFITFNTVSAFGSLSGSSIINFILFYIIGVYLSRVDFTFSRKNLLIALLIIVLLMSGISLADYSLARELNNPINIIFLAVIVLILKGIIFENKLINELSKAAYTCYLFHSNFLIYVGIGWAVKQKLPILILHQVVTGVGLFLVSYPVYRIYNSCAGIFIKKITPICERIDISVRTEENR